MIHLTIQQLSSLLDGELNHDSERLTQEHLDACETCSVRLARLKDQEDALVRVLVSEPDEAFFDGFMRELTDLLQPRGSSSIPTRGDSVEPAPSTQKARIERSRARSDSAPFAWAAGIAIAAIVGAIGVVGFQARLAPRAPGAPQSEASVAPSASGSVPPATDVTTSLEAGAPAPVERAPASTGDVSSDHGDPSGEPPWPPDSIDNPEPGTGQLPSEVESHSDAADYEAVAAQWERSLPLLQGDEYRAARLRAAEGRYRAWQAGPSGERATRAAAAIRAYLAGAPPGSEREMASAWLAEVEEARY